MGLIEKEKEREFINDLLMVMYDYCCPGSLIITSCRNIKFHKLIFIDRHRVKSVTDLDVLQ